MKLVNLKPLGVIVVIKADHFCARLQGDNGEFVTSAYSGVFDHQDTRNEFLKFKKNYRITINELAYNVY